MGDVDRMMFWDGRILETGESLGIEDWRIFGDRMTFRDERWSWNSGIKI